MNKKAVYTSIGILSVSIIAFQVVLIQILSIMQWYHFAYMIISVALLGFGAAGSVVSIFRQRLLEVYEYVLPLLMILSGVSMACVVSVINIPEVSFDSFLLFSDYNHILKLIVTYLLLFIPFFLGALAIGLSFVKYVDHISELYFSNLLGSGLGGLTTVILMWFFPPQQLPHIISILPLFASLFVLNNRYKALPIIIITIVGIQGIDAQGLNGSEFKSINKSKKMPRARIIGEKNSPHGFLQALESPVLRYAPGISLKYTKEINANKIVFNNGDWYGPVIPYTISDECIFNYTTMALPYIMKRSKSVLIINPGTGVNIVHALKNAIKDVTVVESNSALLLFIRENFGKETGYIFNNPDITIHNYDPRVFLSKNSMPFDLIVLPLIGSFGGTGGINAIKENYLLTTESFNHMWSKLSDHGLIAITTWNDYPYRNPLKLLSILCETLKSNGINNLRNHIAAVRSWGTITFILKKSILGKNELTRIRKFCDDMFFTPFILSDINPEERSQYNTVMDEELFFYVESLLSSKRSSFYKEYDFKTEAPSDNKPYFFQYIRLKDFFYLTDIFGKASVPYIELGYFIVLLTFFQILLISIILILMPLFKIGRIGGDKLWIVFYFCGIGLGYMFIEIVLIQYFSLYLKSAIYSVSSVISLMLVFSGIGSFITSKIKTGIKNMVIVSSLIAGMIIVYNFFLPQILERSIGFSAISKSLIMILTVFPLALCMGMPFPMGISYISLGDSKEIPWAWGLNGCVSVISTVAATIIAIELGFNAVMTGAAVAYSITMLSILSKSSFFLKKYR